MVRLALYLASGFALLVIFEGPQIDTANAWTWVWILGWPIPVALFVAKWFLIFFLACLAISIAIIVWEEWR